MLQGPDGHRLVIFESHRSNFPAKNKIPICSQNWINLRLFRVADTVFFQAQNGPLWDD